MRERDSHLQAERGDSRLITMEKGGAISGEDAASGQSTTREEAVQGVGISPQRTPRTRRQKPEVRSQNREYARQNG